MINGAENCYNGLISKQPTSRTSTLFHLYLWWHPWWNRPWVESGRGGLLSGGNFSPSLRFIPSLFRKKNATYDFRTYMNLSNKKNTSPGFNFAIFGTKHNMSWLRPITSTWYDSHQLKVCNSETRDLVKNCTRNTNFHPTIPWNFLKLMANNKKTVAFFLPLNHWKSFCFWHEITTYKSNNGTVSWCCFDVRPSIFRPSSISSLNSRPLESCNGIAWY